MARYSNIVTAVELGTSKITVLLGESDGENSVRIIARGSESSAGSVVKGEIQDMDKLQSHLENVIQEINRDDLFNASRAVAFLVTGCEIASQSGVGNATIRNPEHVVTEEEIAAAKEDAKVLNLSSSREIINSSESFSLVDNRRVGKPLGHTGTKLETHAHIVHGVSSQIDNFRRALTNVGFERELLYPIFSPHASDIGILSDTERKNGVLLVDLGAGCSEYILEYDNGIHASGMLQVGFDHVINDLSLAFNLHFDLCKKLILSGALEQAISSRQEYMEFRNTAGSIRQIPVTEFITVIDCRLEEIFAIIRKKLSQENAPQTLGAGGVLTGGGAKFSRAPEMFRKVFGLSCQVRCPADVGGAITGMDDPAFSAVWGALKIAAFYADQQEVVKESWIERAEKKLLSWGSRKRNAVK